MIGRITFSTSGFKLLLYGDGGWLPGYFIGILAGYWVQKLGWIAGLFELAAIMAIPSMIILRVPMQFWFKGIDVDLGGVIAIVTSCGDTLCVAATECSESGRKARPHGERRS